MSLKTGLQSKVAEIKIAEIHFNLAKCYYLLHKVGKAFDHLNLSQESLAHSMK